MVVLPSLQNNSYSKVITFMTKVKIKTVQLNTNYRSDTIHSNMVNLLTWIIQSFDLGTKLSQ